MLDIRNIYNYLESETKTKVFYLLLSTGYKNLLIMILLHQISLEEVKYSYIHSSIFEGCL